MYFKSIRKYYCGICNSEHKDIQDAVLCEKQCKCNHEIKYYIDFVGYIIKYCIKCNKDIESVYPYRLSSESISSYNYSFSFPLDDNEIKILFEDMRCRL